jgi:hypothetical protein
MVEHIPRLALLETIAKMERLCRLANEKYNYQFVTMSSTLGIKNSG